MVTDVAKHEYQPVTPLIVAQLRAIAGEQHVIYDDPTRMQDYAHDEVAGVEHAHMPEVVVKPDTSAQIADIMRLANRERIPVTPRGAGSGLSCGAVPVYGGILLSLERMNRILETDRENMVVVVEPGVVTNDINEAVRDYGLFYAGYPMSVEVCFIAATWPKTRGGVEPSSTASPGRYVLGMEVVLPTGEIIQLGGKRVKDVTGYDVLRLMVGSEGTLGIFTRIILRLLPLPMARVVFADTVCGCDGGHRSRAQDHDPGPHCPGLHRVHGSPVGANRLRSPGRTSTSAEHWRDAARRARWQQSGTGRSRVQCDC